MSSLTINAVSGTKWTTLAFGTQAIIQIVRLSVLTRFLEKSDFGLVAIVVLILGFTHLFTDLGVSASLFSRQNISKREYSSLYWVSIILALALYCCLLGVSAIIADFYELPKLKELLPIMGLDLIVSSAGRQFRVFKQKALSFKSLAVIDIISQCLSVILAIFLALYGFGIYSLILSTLFASLLSTVLLILSSLKAHPLVFYIDIKESKGFYKVGFYQTGSQVLDYIASQIDIIIIGKILPLADLGVYNLIKQLILRVYGMVNPIVTSVSIPILSKIQSDTDLLVEKYQQMVRIVRFMNLGIYGLLALFSKEILTIMYGVSYVNSSLALRLLCIWGVFTAVSGAVSSVIVVTGRTDIGFQWTVFRIALNPLFILFGSFYSLNGIIIAQCFVSVIFYFVYIKFVAHRIIRTINTKYLIREILFPFLYTLIAISVLILFNEFMLQNILPYIFQVVILFFGFGLYYYILNKRIINFLFLTIKNK